MKKKLLVLFAVLAMTSVASAAMIDIWITDLNDEPLMDPVKEITVGWSDWVSFDIIYSQDGSMTLLSLSADIVVAGLGTLDMTQPTWAKDEGFNNITELEAGLAYNVATGSFGGMGTGMLVDHLLVHCDEDEPANDVFVTIAPSDMWGGTKYINNTAYDGGWGTGIVVHNVPEPMTIALLGLGSLVLLRRRK